MSAKRITIDGEPKPLHTAAVVSLRPGLHTVRVQFPSSGNRPPHPAFEKRIRVAPRTPSAVFLWLEPNDGVPRLEGWETPPDAFAWVEIATPEPAVRLVIDGVPYDAPGTCALPLAYDDYTIRIEADGREAVERSVHLEDPELLLLAEELAPEGSTVETVTLYGPADRRVREGLRALENLRVFYESDTRDPNDLSRRVDKAYFGLVDAARPGRLLLEIQLAHAPARLELEPFAQDTAPAGFTVLEIGPSSDALIPMAIAGGIERVPPDLRAALQLDEGPPLDNVGDPERLARLVEALAGGTTLWMRFTLGGESAGADAAFACALRTNELPTPVADGGKWSPALTLRAHR